MSEATILKTTVCIVGAGPAGATASLFLAKHKIPHIILDKSQFPRDKVCGDALTLEAMHTLQLIERDYVYEFSEQPKEFLDSWGLLATAPNGKKLKMLLPESLPYAPFYTVKREDFDQFLVDKLDQEYAQTFFGASISKIFRAEGKVYIHFKQAGQEYQIVTDLVFGADGATSVVAKSLSQEVARKNLTHNSASVRAYFSGVTGFSSRNEIEFHFLPEFLPGYFWIFPMPNGWANVGLIVPSKDADKLRDKFHELVTQHTRFADRFTNAQQEGKLLGWSLPLNSAKKQLAGDNFMLLGDAGSLIEPFSGKGIGIAMLSAKVAVEFTRKAIEANDFSAMGLQAYHEAIYRRYGTEWWMSYQFQRWFENTTRVNALMNLYNFPLMRKLVESLLTKWVKKWML